MNIRIQNFPPDITVEAIRDFLGACDEITEIILTDAGNSDDVVAVLKLSTSHTGAEGIAEFIDGRFYQDRRLSAQVLTLLND